MMTEAKEKERRKRRTKKKGSKLASTSPWASLFERSGSQPVTDQGTDCACWQAVHLARWMSVAHALEEAEAAKRRGGG